MKKKNFEIVWSPESLKQIRKIKKAKSKEKTEKYFLRIKDLIDDIQNSPYSGTGKPEPLNYKLPPVDLVE